MISVIMLTYNRATFVKNMIEDILSQSYSDFEFIIIDNGSSDNTREILKHYREKECRIKIIAMNEPHSIGYARNRGVEAARGEYIAFVDDDDRVKIDYLEFLFNLINENKADISISGCTEGDGTSRKPQCLFDEKIVTDGTGAVKFLLKRDKIRAGMSPKLYKREILQKYPFEENCRNEDVHTQYKYLLEADKVVMHGLDKYYYLRHGSNISGFTSDANQWNKEIMTDYLRAYRNRTEYIEKKAPSIASLSRYCEWSFWISMVDKITKHDLKDCLNIKNDLVSKLNSVKEEFLSHPEIKDFEKKWMEAYVINGNN
ncbi:glycosyltransferase family 2 protein [Schwartzia succinivorans]|nr:glycosyltransferase family 2 protein [Schwartzia succinivorans]